MYDLQGMKNIAFYIGHVCDNIFYNVTDFLREKISIKNKKSTGSEVDVNYELYCLLNRSSIVESSSLFMRNQCSWISWVPLTHDFTSPRTFIKVMNCLTL